MPLGQHPQQPPVLEFLQHDPGTFVVTAQLYAAAVVSCVVSENGFQYGEGEVTFTGQEE